MGVLQRFGIGSPRTSSKNAPEAPLRRPDPAEHTPSRIRSRPPEPKVRPSSSGTLARTMPSECGGPVLRRNAVPCPRALPRASSARTAALRILRGRPDLTLAPGRWPASVGAPASVPPVSGGLAAHCTRKLRHLASIRAFEERRPLQDRRRPEQSPHSKCRRRVRSRPEVVGGPGPGSPNPSRSAAHLSSGRAGEYAGPLS
jgi:hypothetical protein